MFLFKSKTKLSQLKEDIINEQKSPLFRIMSVFNSDESTRRSFANNICAFSIGNGYILSVAHNLRAVAGKPDSMSESEYQNIFRNLNHDQKTLFNNSYTLDTQINKRYINRGLNQNNIKQLTEALDQINYDTRWLTFYERGICKPFLIVQFRENKFYQDDIITQQINPVYTFYEAPLFRYTFLIELKLVETFYGEDYALYRIVNNNSLIEKIPFLEIDYNLYTESNNDLFCLQSAPIDNLGRLLNTAELEGILDHWDLFKDKFGGDYTMDGLRYLIKGYFRFGSSGAPYLKYDPKSKILKVNAIQSEASPIQLMINNNREGNFQYINAIASPIKNIETSLRNIKKIIV